MTIERTNEGTDILELDAVCGAPVDEDGARDLGLVETFGGREYPFCGAACQRAFRDAPAMFAEVERDSPPIP